VLPLLVPGLRGQLASINSLRLDVFINLTFTGC
jgi:hypothetical protein